MKIIYQNHIKEKETSDISSTTKMLKIYIMEPFTRNIQDTDLFTKKKLKKFIFNVN